MIRSAAPSTAMPTKCDESPLSPESDDSWAPDMSDDCGYTVERLPPLTREYYSDGMRAYFERGRNTPPAMYIATQKPHPDERSSMSGETC